MTEVRSTGVSLTTKDPLTEPRGASRIDPEVSPLSFAPLYLRAVSGLVGRVAGHFRHDTRGRDFPDTLDSNIRLV